MRQALEALETLARYENPETRIQVRKPKDGGPIVTMYPHKVASDAATALRAAIEQYDQTALELCKECGWRALIPGEGCLTCARQKAKPVAWMYDFMADNRDEVIRDWMTQDHADIARENGFNVRPLYTAPPAVTQKPVAYADSRIHGWPDCFVMEPDPPHTVPLYAAPREWVGLTDEEIVELIKPAMSYYGYNPDHAVLTSGAGFVGLADAIEAKLKEKNAA